MDRNTPKFVWNNRKRRAGMVPRDCKRFKLSTLHQKHECNFFKKYFHLSIAVPLENSPEDITNVMSYLGRETV